MKKLILYVVGFFMACSAYASFPVPTVYFSSNGPGGSSAHFPSAEALCENARAVKDADRPEVVYVIGTPSVASGCKIGYMIGAQEFTNSYSIGTILACPSNSTASGGQCACSAGYDETGSSCVAHVNQCASKIGKPWVTNFTVGYMRTDGLGSNSDDYSCVGTCNQVPVSKQICDAGCTVELGQPKAAWRSAQPTSNGLYRLSIDFISVPTGAECTQAAADAPANPSTPEPACPGFVGEINGKKGCYGTAGTPINTMQADRSTSGAAPGNPAAGNMPATGEGSGSTGAGRTPSTGTGGPSGGPASAAIGPRGTVATPPTGEEQAACGAPGQPKCAIDETGTPTGVGVLPTTQFEAKLQERQDALSTVASASGKDTTWGVMPQWTQGGTCSPWHMFTLPPVLGSYSVDIDVCPVKPFADGMANFIWISLAFMGITAMVFNTMTSKAN